MPPRLYYDAKNPGLVTVERPFYQRLGETSRRTRVESIVVPIRTGRAWPVRKGRLCRIVALEGPQVCDFNAWNLHNPRERFWAARSRQFEGAHVTTGKRLWSCLPYLRPILTFTNDTLPRAPTPSGGRCHDLLGSRCDPYLYKLQNASEFNLTCHNNLARAIAREHLTPSPCPLPQWGRGMRTLSLRGPLQPDPSPPSRGRGPQFELSGAAARRGLSKSGGLTTRESHGGEPMRRITCTLFLLLAI